MRLERGVPGNEAGDGKACKSLPVTRLHTWN